jgi:hypothetical protein
VTANDLTFLRGFRAYLANGRTDADYLELFSACPEGRITGEITPEYSMLRPSRIEHVHGLLPEARILLVIRDPVSRAWSQSNMSLRKSLGRPGMARPELLRAMAERVQSDGYLERLVRRKTLIGKGTPTRIYRNWAKVYQGNVEVLGFDEVCVKQGAVADKIAALFELPATGGSDVLVRNRKEDNAKVPMGDRERDFLVQHFRDELFECRELFGETKTPGWLEKYGLA